MTPHGANWFAFVALAAWGPLVLFAFARLRPATAVLFAVLGADLLLPVGLAFSFQGFPDLPANRIGALAALVGCLLFHPGRLRSVFSRPWIPLFVALLGVSAMATALTNADITVQGGRALDGIRPYDGFSMWASLLLDYGIPFLLGTALFRRERDLLLLHRWVVVAALLYTLPILYELRMSPQLHNIFYGYFPHSFLQAIRGGGYRPVVFLGHGLVVSMFLATAVILSVGLWRARAPLWRNLPAWPAAAFLFAILVLCKSMAPVLYALAGGALLLLASARVRMIAASALAAIAISYPALRTAGSFPTQPLLEAAASVSQDRADSLAFRFENEDVLLARAQERIWFGWAGYGRNRVFDEEGYDRTVTDGMWIITLGAHGIVGFTILFGVFALAIGNSAWVVARLRAPRAQTLLSSLALLLALRLVDCLPNAGFGSFLFLLVGAAAGLRGGLPAEHRARRRAAAAKRLVRGHDRAPSPVERDAGPAAERVRS